MPSCRPRSKRCALLPPAVVLALLSGCGQYGDLYLPERPEADQPRVKSEETPADTGRELLPDS
jgi:predicted small lipoprotein YifL